MYILVSISDAEFEKVEFVWNKSIRLDATICLLSAPIRILAARVGKNIPFGFFYVLKEISINLTELCLCCTDISDCDLKLNNPKLPLLKTICLKDCKAVTSNGIVSFIQLCKSLENIYVDRDVAESYAEDPFIITNKSQLEIVIVISDYDHHNKLLGAV